MSRSAYVALAVAGAAAIAIAVFAQRSRYDALPAIEPPHRTNFDPAAIRLGSSLASLGNCLTCHSSEDGVPFAGGRALRTSFGTLYSPNITPEPATGIGRWSLQAFRRAMRSGVDREGRPLYPAFPYDHLTRVSDSDATALYAYLMTRRPVRRPARPNALAFPYSMRWSLVLWRTLYFHPGAFRPDPSRDARWNRGAYLVEGLAHCGACHTPRDAFGAEKASARFAGGTAEGWDAYPIGDRAQPRIPWDSKSLETYLRTGWEASHGIAQGPMAQVTDNLALVAAADVEAIVAYLLAPQLPQSADPGAKPNGASPPAVDAVSAPREEPPDGDSRGAIIYRSACESCHEGPQPPLGGMPLELSADLNAAHPTNLVHVVLEGLAPPSGRAGPIMPGFAGSLSDEQLHALCVYLRARFGRGAAWKDIAESLRAVRYGTGPSP